MENTVKYRAGLQPDMRRIETTISTSYAAKYLQERFDRIERSLNATYAQKAAERGDEVQKAPHIEIVLASVELGKNFAPIYAILPEDVLDRSSYNPNTPSVFRPDLDDEAVWLKPVYHALLKNYMFDKDDRAAFRSMDWRRARGITGHRNIQALQAYATPKIEEYNDGNHKIRNVAVFIDPIRLFHDMLVNESLPNQRFRIYIQKFRPTTDETKFEYVVAREVVGKNKGAGNSVVNDLLRKINPAFHKR